MLHLRATATLAGVGESSIDSGIGGDRTLRPTHSTGFSERTSERATGSVEPDATGGPFPASRTLRRPSDRCWQVGTVATVNDPGADVDGWVRVRIAVDVASDPAAGEIAAAVLWSAGAAGVEEQGDGESVVLLGGFERREGAQAAVRRALDLGIEAAVAPVADGGLDAWRAWATATRAGRFWITPTWVDAPALDPGDEVLWIDPGPTFGSGSHPTTRLVLALLEQLVLPGTAVLDVGTGSGVLAIGAARLGAGATAVDIDPASPGVVDANAVRNGVGADVQASTDPLAAIAARGPGYDVVAANLLAPVIVELGADLVRCVRRGGALVASGLLADRWEAVLPALAPLVPEQVAEEDGWVAVVLR
jgi:ribosomal protein L11 methyltransferase